ncbi:NB-ARC domains-containing protein [Tanacetum coccineum]
MKHLRYLNLSTTGITHLPEIVCNLYNLQTLIVSGCYRLTALPDNLLKLKNLQHFDIRDTLLWDMMPLGISEMKSLQTLSNKIVVENNDFFISWLKNLKNLQGNISIQGLDNCGDGVLTSLIHVASAVTKLSICRISGLSDEVWRGVMEYLGAVEEVSIWYCNEIRYMWESEAKASKVLVNLRTLKVYNCSKMRPQNFPPSLVVLALFGGSAEEDDVSSGSQLSHMLPSSLTELHLCFFGKLESVSMGLQHLTSLQHLYIQICRKIQVNIMALDVISFHHKDQEFDALKTFTLSSFVAAAIKKV